MIDLSPQSLAAIAGLILGAIFGATVHRTNFCVMGAVSDSVLLGDRRRLRAWLLAIAVAVAGAEALHLAGLIDLHGSIYLGPRLGWAGGVLGGLAFGAGMVLAGGCASRNLARIGGGSLKALMVVLVLGVVAGMTLRGLLAHPRLWLEGATALSVAETGHGVPELLARVTGLDLPWRGLGAVLAVVSLLAVALLDRRFRATPAAWAGGLAVGAVVVGGWAATGILAADEFEPMPLASLTFVAPTADAVLYAMTATGTALAFGAASVFGTVLGAFLAAMAGRSFRLETFRDPGDMVAHVAGAALMGAGGVIALGCTVGQGVTGLSTLALGSLVAVGAIVAGAVLALRVLARGGDRPIAGGCAG